MIPETARQTLARVFGHSGFRTGQAEACAALEAGRDVQVLLPTGSGKSLCYQLPAARAAERGRVTLVVSPLIALMDDQVAALERLGVHAVALHSGRSPEERRQSMVSIEQRGGVVFASPERLAVKRFRDWLNGLPLAYAAVDEAHCISEWGHDFRKDYLALGVLKRELGLPVLAATATATPRVMDEIAQSLGLFLPLVVNGDFARPNLALSVEHVAGDNARAARVVALVKEAAAAGGRAIVYAATRKRVKAVHDVLRKAGLDAGYYHAGRSAEARVNAQSAYEQGRRPVLVATSAFGMGIDHPDVRLVVHAEAPGTLEDYYQQAGRAGRDGRPARCVLLYSPKDAVTQARLRGASPTPGAQAGWKALQDYVFGQACRSVHLAGWFAAQVPQCGGCDVCRQPELVAAMVHEARTGASDRHAERTARRQEADDVDLTAQQDATILAFVDALDKPVGKRMIALGLRGSNAKDLRRKGLHKNPHHGALTGLPERALVQAVERLLAEGRLERKGKKYPTVWVAGKRVRPPRDPSAPAKPRGLRTANPTEEALKRFRARAAKRLRWRPYQVFDNKTLKALAQQRPGSMIALADVPGMGPKRIERFGDQILEILAG